MHLSQSVGWCEVIMGVMVLIKPSGSFLIFVLIWKIGTELLRPLSRPTHLPIHRTRRRLCPTPRAVLVGRFLEACDYRIPDAGKH
jgi:hypothetical protein